MLSDLSYQAEQFSLKQLWRARLAVKKTVERKRAYRGLRKQAPRTRKRPFRHLLLKIKK